MEMKNMYVNFINIKLPPSNAINLKNSVLFPQFHLLGTFIFVLFVLNHKNMSYHSVAWREKRGERKRRKRIHMSLFLLFCLLLRKKLKNENFKQVSAQDKIWYQDLWFIISRWHESTSIESNEPYWHPENIFTENEKEKSKKKEKESFRSRCFY